jgi:hypothetical protein
MSAQQGDTYPKPLKLVVNAVLAVEVEAGLQQCWSPGEIAGTPPTIVCVRIDAAIHGTV